MAKYDDIDTKMVATVGVVSVLIVVGSILAIQVLYNNFDRAEAERKVIAVESADVRNLLAEQEARLNRAGWIDRQQGLIAIPIERAMELVVEEMRSVPLQPTTQKGAER